MPAPHPWTQHADLTLHRMRAEGASWQCIALALGVSRWAAAERGRALHARIAPQPRPARPAASTTRAPLAAGDPIAWHAIADTAFPWPPLPVTSLPVTSLPTPAR